MKDIFEQLQGIMGDIDFLFQEGVVITLEEKASFIRLFEQGLDYMAEINHTNEAGNLVMPLNS